MSEVELELVLPELGAVEVEEVQAVAGVIRISARTRDVPVVCPGCGCPSGWEHSRYVRHVADESVGGRPMVVDLSVRRLYCENPRCPKSTFAEQVGGLTVRYQRRSPALQAVVTAVVVALAGKAGARLLLHLHQVLSWSTLLTVVLAVPDPLWTIPTVLAVDDFALRRGRSYGTLLVDAETRLPIELWDTREAAPLAAWLAVHPGIEVVCRDGSAVYRSAISTGAPKAVQVSDRFHLWQGLGRRVVEVVAAHRSSLTPPVPVPVPAPAPDDTPAPALAPDTRAAQRARHNHGAVHALLEQGVALRVVAHRLPLDRNAVRRYARAATWQETVPTWPRHSGIIAPYHDYLQQRWDEGAHSPTALYREITARGFTGCNNTVMYHCRTLPDALESSRAALQQALSTRQAARWMLTHPENLREEDRIILKDLLMRCPPLATVHDRVRSFEVIEGRVTDLKLIKRQMGGRARIRLLRKRVILVAHSRRSNKPAPITDDPWAINAHESLV